MHSLLTLSRRGVIYIQVKVIRLTHVVCEDDFSLEFEDRYTGAIESYSRLAPLRIELVKNRRSHVYCIKRTKVDEGVNGGRLSGGLGKGTGIWAASPMFPVITGPLLSPYLEVMEVVRPKFIKMRTCWHSRFVLLRSSTHHTRHGNERPATTIPNL